MIITTAFGKGGTGKTSTAYALVNYAKMKGKSVLAIDCDPQANFTFALNGSTSQKGLFSILAEGIEASQVIQHTEQADIIASGLDLATTEQIIINKPGRDFILKQALAPIRNNYDLIVIDTQPDLNSLLINALSTSDAVILPMQANSFSIMGLYQMQETISQVQRYCNPELKIAGILLTKYKPRQILAADMRESIEKLAKEMNTNVFNTYIREGVAIEQAQAMQKSLFEYAPNSNPAVDYRTLFENELHI